MSSPRATVPAAPVARGAVPESDFPAPTATATATATNMAQWRALGCDVLLAVTDPDALARGRAILAEDLAALDLAASRFRPDSEVAALARAGRGTHRISPLLADLLDAALTAAQRTDGDLDPTIGAQLIALGYDRDLADLDRADLDLVDLDRADLDRADLGPAGNEARLADVPTIRIRRPIDWRSVELDVAAGTVRMPAGVVLDLGATAKARAADRSATRLADELGCGVLVSLGGDVAVNGAPPPGGWVVRVQDVAGDPEAPVPPGSSSCLVGINSGGLATSSTTARRWRHGGSVLHHILDPRTGGPSPDVWRTVTVAAPTCLAANVASTTAVIRGGSALAWLISLGLPARLVATPAAAVGRGSSDPVLLGGWPVPEEVAA